MITPHQMDDALLADIAACRAAQQSEAAQAPNAPFDLWWLGQSGFLLLWQGRSLLFDPYLSDSLTKKYAPTDKPHVRMTERAVDPARLTHIDVVTASHAHTDHLDGETLCPLLTANPNLTLVVPAAASATAAERAQVSPNRLTLIDAGRSVDAAGFKLHAIPAAHETVERDATGHCLFLGYVVQFGPWTIYHSGDTIGYAEQGEWLRPYSIDIALLPINGRLPERRVAGNLWGREAAELASSARARMVIPCHFELFEFNTVTPDEFIAACRALRQPHRVLKCGERFSSAAIGADMAL